MIEYVKNEIRNACSDSDVKYISSHMIDDIFLNLVYVLYLIQTNQNIIDDFINVDSFILKFGLLRMYIPNEKFVELVENFIDTNYKKLTDGIDISNDTIDELVPYDDKTLLLMGNLRKYPRFKNMFICFTSIVYPRYKLYNSVLDFNNEIIKYKDLDFSFFDKFIIFDNFESFSGNSQKTKIFDLIRNLVITQNKQVILKTKYKNISHFDWHLLHLLDKVYISFDKDNDECLLFLNKNLKRTNCTFIKYYSNVDYFKDDVSDELKLVLSYSDISHHNYAIGFNTYLNDDKDINEYIERNNELIKTIKKHNEDIDEELNKFFNKGIDL